MTTVGIPARKIGTSNPNSAPGDFGGNTVGIYGYSFLSRLAPRTSRFVHHHLHLPVQTGWAGIETSVLPEAIKRITPVNRVAA
jgi:hypothetical protein